MTFNAKIYFLALSSKPIYAFGVHLVDRGKYMTVLPPRTQFICRLPWETRVSATI